MAAIVREVRPAILHAHSGYRGGEHALIALALRERFGIPVVYEVRGLFEAVWSPDPELAERSEQYARRLARRPASCARSTGSSRSRRRSQTSCHRAASRATKITIVPNGIDTDALGRPVRDPTSARRSGSMAGSSSATSATSTTGAKGSAS